MNLRNELTGAEKTICALKKSLPKIGYNKRMDLVDLTSDDVCGLVYNPNLASKAIFMNNEGNCSYIRRLLNLQNSSASLAIFTSQLPIVISIQTFKCFIYSLLVFQFKNTSYGGENVSTIAPLFIPKSLADIISVSRICLKKIERLRKLCLKLN